MNTEKKKMILKMLSVFLVCGYALAGQTTYLEAANGPYASNPDPADGAEIEGELYPEYPPQTHIWTMLIFEPGVTAVKHTGYFSEDYSKVYSRHQDANLGSPPFPYPMWDNVYFAGYPEVDPANETLVRGTTYYWCVDETDGNNVVWQGPVWSFYVQSYYATKPDPPNEAININPDVLLSWQGGYDVDEHDIYFGTSWQDVNNADVFDFTGIYQGWTFEPNYQCSNLAFNTRYYWRVDEVHDRWLSSDLGTIYKDDVWSFTTAPQRIFVDIDAAGTNNGTSWENAYNYLQDALIEADSALKPVEIRVAEGIYTPDSNSADPNGSGDRTATFKLINGVTLKGGYAGFDEPDPNARDIELYETILSGDLDGNDLEVNDPCDLENEPTRAENSYHVVIAIETDETAVLDGFTITAGNANGKGWPVYQNFGGGMYNDSGSPSVINCMFSDNSASNRGGGIYNWGGSPTLTNCMFSGNSAGIGGGIENNDGSPRLTNCTFIGNSARHSGGGMYSCCGWSVLMLTNCTFKGNWSYGSYGQGGGLCCDNGIMMMINCTFSGNSARHGGGMWYIDGNDRYQTLANCRFSGNSAYMGGGMFCTFSSPKLINCTLSGNSAEYGEGIYVEDGSNPTLTNCILWGNRNTNGTDESAQFDEVDEFIINYCCVGGWNGHLGGVGNIEADPCFVEPGYWEDPCNTPGDYIDDIWVEGDYHLKSQAGRWDPNSETWVQDDVTSPCIDSGNPGCPLGDEPVPNGNRRNMGAYGGTAEASKSPAKWRSIADLTNDWAVDSNDLKVFVGYWLQMGECIPSDLNRSQSVDFNDFAIFGLQWSYPTAFEPGMTFQIDDCNMEDGPSWTVVAESNEPRFSVWVEGRYIYFEDQMYANCCPEELGLDKEINGNEITLYEIGYGGLCFCMCYFPITATLGPFEDGTYTVEVYDNYGNSLGVVEVTIGGATGPGLTYQIKDCSREASVSFTAEPPDQTRFTVTVEGLYIHFEDMMYANCCPDKLELEMTVEDNLITIYETEYTSEGCRCICSFPITATLGPFEPGTYTLEVYEHHGGFIGSTTVVIDPPE